MSAAPQTREPFEIIGAGDDADWHQRRSLGVGASEAAMMLGLHPRHGEGGPAVLWAWKTGRQEPEPLDDLEFIQWGHIMEPVIVEQYSTPRYAGRRVEKTREQLRSLVHPWALCTLDAWTWHPEHGRIPLEAKNVGGYQAERWLDGPPIEMWWQLQHQMLVTGKPAASIAACVGGNALWWEDVERSDDAQRRLISSGAAFWACVREDRVPLHVPTLASVRALYPAGRETGLVQLSGDEWTSADERLCEVKSELSRLEAERASLEAKIKNAIGDHESASLDSGVTYTHRTQTRAEHTVAASEFKVMRRKAPKGERR
jgi:predicted phage-related endonuclease